MVLIDTDVLVEYLRGSAEAKAWLASLQKEQFSIPGVVAMELVMGCQNKNELGLLQRFLDAFDILWPSASDFSRAFQILQDLRLTSGLGIPDCLIAGMALAQGDRLYSFNLKHFQMVPGLDVKQPYERLS